MSVSQMADALARAGVEVGLWAADGTVWNSPLIGADPPYQRLSGPPGEALRSFGQADIVHDNGIWLWHNHVLSSNARRLKIPRVISTRGMLEPWALNHKRFKKAIAWRVYQERDIRSAQCLHATSEGEWRSLSALNLSVPVEVIPNGVEAPEGDGQTGGSGSKSTRTALFVGRLHPVKGLPMLLEAWGEVRPAGWRLQISGHDEDGYLQVLRKAARAAGIDEDVIFTGPLDGEAKRSALADAGLFVLPSYSENFGMAVGEALCSGVPVLTTSATPWGEIEAKGCGWSVPPHANGLAEGLRQATALSEGALSAMGERGRRYVTAEFGWGRIAGKLIGMYEGILGGRRADCR